MIFSLFYPILLYSIKRTIQLQSKYHCKSGFETKINATYPNKHSLLLQLMCWQASQSLPNCLSPSIFFPFGSRCFRYACRGHVGRIARAFIICRFPALSFSILSCSVHNSKPEADVDTA